MKKNNEQIERIHNVIQRIKKETKYTGLSNREKDLIDQLEAAKKVLQNVLLDQISEEDEKMNLHDNLPIIKGDHALNCDAIAQNDYMSPSGHMYSSGKALLDAADYIRKNIVISIEYPDETSRIVTIVSQRPNHDLVIFEECTEGGYAAEAQYKEV